MRSEPSARAKASRPPPGILTTVGHPALIPLARLLHGAPIEVCAKLEGHNPGVDRVASPDPETGDYLAARLKRVAHLVKTVHGAFNLNPYALHDNLRSARAALQDRGLCTLVLAVDALSDGLWPAGTRVAVILPDHGERDLATVYDHARRKRHSGSMPPLSWLQAPRQAADDTSIPTSLAKLEP